MLQPLAHGVSCSGIALRRAMPVAAWHRRYCATSLAESSSGSRSSPLRSSSSTAPTSVVAGQSSVPALPPTGAYEIAYKGPIAEDEKGGANVSSKVDSMWSNIPTHIRESFKPHQSTNDAPVPAQPLMLDGYYNKARALMAQTGFAPASWSLGEGDAASYYGGLIPLAPHKKGQTAAYH